MDLQFDVCAVIELIRESEVAATVGVGLGSMGREVSVESSDHEHEDGRRSLRIIRTVYVACPIVGAGRFRVIVGHQAAVVECVEARTGGLGR